MSAAAALQIYRRTWLKVLRRPVTLTFSLAQPLLWMLFFGFLFERYRLIDGRAEGLRYLDFLAPGVCAMTVLFGASQSGVSWIRDLQIGFLPRLLATPASRHALLGGKIAADVSRLMLQALGVLALALMLGVRLEPRPSAVAPGLLALLLFATAFSCLSCALALRARSQEVMATFIHLVNMPMLFTSTALVPTRQMPPWLAGVAEWNPLSLAVDAWRGALLLGESVSWLGQIAPLAALAAALYALALREMCRLTELY
ncbi:MAG: ABC transporter permease [Acidobacteriota bacterium]